MLNSNGTYQHKNLTIYIKREYGQTKKLSDIITSLILQKTADNNNHNLLVSCKMNCPS